MPPKKKRTNANIVVGTVSTRSTRRQSIVNITVPPPVTKKRENKLKKSSDPSSVLKILEDWSGGDSNDSNDAKNSPKNNTAVDIQPQMEQIHSVEAAIDEIKPMDAVHEEIKPLEAVTEEIKPNLIESAETELENVKNVHEVSAEECFVLDNNDDVIQEQVIGFESSEEEVPLECINEEVIASNLNEIKDEKDKNVIIDEIKQDTSESTDNLIKELESDEPLVEILAKTEEVKEKTSKNEVEGDEKCVDTEPSEVEKKHDEIAVLKDNKCMANIDFDELKAVLQKCNDSIAENKLEASKKIEIEPKKEENEAIETKQEKTENIEDVKSAAQEGDIIKAILEQKINELKLTDVKVEKKEKELNKTMEDLSISESQESLKEKLDLIEQLNREKQAKKQRELKQKLKAKERKMKQQKEAKRKDKLKKNDAKIDDENLVRRSSRIKSINVMKKRSTGHGLVRSKSESGLEIEMPETNQKNHAEIVDKVQPLKVRSKSMENTTISPQNETIELSEEQMEIDREAEEQAKAAEVAERLKQFVHLKENLYLTDRMTCKEAKHMTCDCFLTEVDIQAGEFGCGDDCLNRLLMIECGNQCPVLERCTNKRFQKSLFAPVEVFKTEKKGLGLRAAANVPYGEFILEYVGEVVDPDEFEKRAENYSNGKNIHYYFMSLRADAIIDATMKGNISRFINHSCDPNAETQKWTVNGELRIGFFSTRTILAGEEITFDYRFQRYGKEAQKCYCESNICRGWLGEEPDDDSDEDDDEEDDLDLDSVEKKDANDSGKVKKERSRDPRTGRDDAKSQIAPKKKRSPKKKQRKDLFEDLDLDEEIQMLMATGLKNQAHTLKLSRLIVRAKEPSQRTKLLRILRRGELPCRRLFLDYHGLRLMHGYMVDVQHLVRIDKKFESLRLELLQTLATLPIPNKTMLQDSKVLPTVEEWSVNKEVASPQDSDSNSPKPAEATTKPAVVEVIEEPSSTSEVKIVQKPPPPPIVVQLEDNQINYQEEIVALALKLLEEWSNLKEVFRIPKKERIEQMKEHEREANRKFMAMQQDAAEHEKRNDRYRGIRQKLERNGNDLNQSVNRKNYLDRNNPYARLSKDERRKIFALQVELKEEERRLKQREFWRQHEQNCLIMGTDPRLTAPFDPNRPYQCIWNPQIGQWQTIPPAGLPPIKQPYNMPLPVPNWPTNTTIPAISYQEMKDEDVTQVKFMGPIPPPVKLPPKWKTSKDKYGRPYYYHIKIRISQWEPPGFGLGVEEAEFSSETESSSDTSSLSSDSSSENSDSDDDIDDTQLLLQVRKQMEKSAKLNLVKVSQQMCITSPPQPTVKLEEIEEKFSPEEKEQENDVKEEIETEDDKETSIDVRLKRQFDVLKEDEPIVKKKRSNLVEEIIISPRTEEDRLQFREDLKRYKQNKEKLKRQKELILQQKKKQLRELEGKKHKEKTVVASKQTIKTRIKEMVDFNSDVARKIKENFRSNMATVVVSVLNSYRKPDCKEGRITNTEDFKHLARKLTHFVMLKEMKHISKIEELTCTDNVKTKAREYIKKYMSKFGEVYQKRNDEPDFRD